MPINTTRLLNIFTTLAEIASPSGEEKQIAEKISTLIKCLGLKPYVDEHKNIIVSIPGQLNAEPIILNAHLDTVEPGRNIKLVIDDKLIQSDGKTIAGIDDKVGIAAILETIQTLHDEDYKNNRPLDVIFTVHEETSTDGPKLLDYSKIKAKKGYSFDAPMPVGTISLASPFYNRFRFLLKGKDAHAARPDLGLNALALTIAALSKVKLGKLDADSIRNIRIADAETQQDSSAKYGINMSVNKVPGMMVGLGEVRSFIEKNVERYTDEVEQIFQQEIEKSGQPFELEFEKIRENGGFKYSKNDPFVEQTLISIKNLGLEPQFYSGFSCYDANVFAEMGVQIINCCLGSEFHHTTRGRITIENLNKLGNLVYGLTR